MKKRREASKVYFVDMRSSTDGGVLDKLAVCMNKAGIHRIADESDLLAVKLHFGEKGSTASLGPAYVRTALDVMRDRGCFPFLTDTNTLYVGSRSDSVRHLRTAVEHGFTYGSMGVPTIIADGLKGGNYEIVRISGKHFDEVKVASDIARADALLVLTHVKGHELTGVGGSLKNLGMGCGSRAGKLAMHSDVRPYVSDRCIGCSKCVSWCPVGAISVAGKKASIATGTCIGCAECIVVCPVKAIRIEWDISGTLVQEKIVEYAAGVVKTKQKKVSYVNFIMDVSPQCDCYPFSDASIVPDVGILASHDPVAIDQASVDLINKQPGLEGTALAARRRGSDKFRGLYPDVDWRVQLKHAEAMGLGTRRYKIIRL
jgi:uncharacterized Fe-S center protein